MSRLLSARPVLALALQAIPLRAESAGAPGEGDARPPRPDAPSVRLWEPIPPQGPAEQPPEVGRAGALKR